LDYRIDFYIRGSNYNIYRGYCIVLLALRAVPSQKLGRGIDAFTLNPLPLYIF
jgi:hypothetical protein